MMTAQEALITLNLIPGLGPVRILSLLEFFGTAELVLEAPAHMLAQIPRIGNKLAAAIADWRNCTHAQAEMDCAKQAGVRILTLLDDDYPPILRRMSDPPLVLYIRGDLHPEDTLRTVSLVGSRMATAYGLTASRRISRDLTDAGCTIISGLARGIDAAAHWGALDAGGRTIAILGNGLSHIFPQENEELARRICQGHGAIISEFPMNMRPSKTSFPQRNRIVAAWSQATLVTEAPLHSGALHTARLSGEQYGNQVFAVPGSIDRPTSAGCHALIRDGAILCTTAQELLDDMGWNDQAPRQLDLFAGEMPSADPLIAAIASGHDTLDALCCALGMGAREVTPQLMRLQITHQVIPLPGGRYQLCQS